MFIELSKEEYRDMLKCVIVANNVYGILGDAVSDEYKRQSTAVELLQKKILAYAAQFESQDLAETFHGELILSDDFSERMDEVLSDYDIETFWHELELRLGKRDFERTMTPQEKEEIEKNGGWLLARIQSCYDRWADEFETHGTERLEINPHAQE